MPPFYRQDAPLFLYEVEYTHTHTQKEAEALLLRSVSGLLCLFLSGLAAADSGLYALALSLNARRLVWIVL